MQDAQSPVHRPSDRLHHLIYASAAARPYSRSDLDSLLAQARRSNSRNAITGMLLYDRGSFLQWIEGPASALDQLYQRLRGDPGHRQLIVLLSEAIDARQFASWSMGFTDLSADELVDDAAVNDFFQGGTVLRALNADGAKKLLLAFRRGAYRVAEGHATFL